MSHNNKIGFLRNQSGITVHDLLNALQFMPPEAKIEICVSQYNKAYPHYLYLETDNNEAALQFGENTVRLFSKLPEDEASYSILSVRKK